VQKRGRELTALAGLSLPVSFILCARQMQPATGRVKIACGQTQWLSLKETLRAKHGHSKLG